MLYVLASLAIALVAASVTAVYYRGQAKAQTSRADAMETTAKNNATVAKQLGAELKALLTELAGAQDEEKDRDESDASKVVTAADAADFLNNSAKLRADSRSARADAKTRVSRKLKRRRSPVVCGFGRHLRTDDPGDGQIAGPLDSRK